METNDQEDRSFFNRELTEQIGELRVGLPGVQMLFAFLLTVPFSQRFDLVTHFERLIYFVAMLCTALASAFLIAPSVYHRLHWRRDVNDKEEMLHTFNRLAITGAVFLAAAMTLALHFITHFLFGSTIAAVMIVPAAALFAGLWFGLPLVRRKRERNRRLAGS